MPLYQHLRQRLASKVGKKVTVTYNHHRQAVIVLSVDAEGFLCRTVPGHAREEEAEFWLPLKEVSHLEESLDPPLVS